MGIVFPIKPRILIRLLLDYFRHKATEMKESRFRFVFIRRMEKLAFLSVSGDHGTMVSTNSIENYHGMNTEEIDVE